MPRQTSDECISHLIFISFFVRQLLLQISLVIKGVFFI